MADLPFDTTVAVRRLRDTGLDERQAETITETIRKGITASVATKADLARLEVELKADLKWIKLIGGAILAVLTFPWLTEFVSGTML